MKVLEAIVLWIANAIGYLLGKVGAEPTNENITIVLIMTILILLGILLLD